MIKVSTHGGEGFRVLTSYGEWKIGMIRYNERFSRLGEMERHLLTDEVFVLLARQGDALYGKRNA